MNLQAGHALTMLFRLSRSKKGWIFTSWFCAPGEAFPMAITSPCGTEILNHQQAKGIYPPDELAL